MSKWPTSVEIGGRCFQVIRCDIEDFGQMRFDHSQILISDRRSKAEQWTTLRHEMMHAALHVGGVSHCENYNEEAVVRCLENLFFPAWQSL